VLEHLVEHLKTNVPEFQHICYVFFMVFSLLLSLDKYHMDGDGRWRWRERSMKKTD